MIILKRNHDAGWEKFFVRCERVFEDIENEQLTMSWLLNAAHVSVAENGYIMAWRIRGY